ncbi:MAG: type II toxin-antitoxin system VapC family toxin [Isosphaeraceae bacterium]
MDTGAGADAIFWRRGVVERLKSARALGHSIGIGIPVLGELYAGAEFSVSREHNMDILRRSLKLFRLWPFTPEAAAAYGRLYAEMRRKGRIIQQVDLQIAAIALALGQCTVVTDDSDLSAVPGLRVENWATQK